MFSLDGATIGVNQINFKIILHHMVCIAIGCRLTVFKWDSTPNSKFNHLVSKLDLTTFFLYLSKITSNLPENYLSRSKTTSEKSYSSKK